MAKTRAQQNREIRQNALREWLSEKCTAQHLVDNIEKIEKLDPADESFKNQLDKYKVANDQRLRVMNKYLPDVRSVDLNLGGQEGNPITTVIERRIVKAND